MIKRIVVPLDGSKLAEMALPHAVAFARANNYGLTLLRVAISGAPMTTAPWGAVPPPNAWENWEEEEREGHHYLQTVAEKDILGEFKTGKPSGIVLWPKGSVRTASMGSTTGITVKVQEPWERKIEEENAKKPK